MAPTLETHWYYLGSDGKVVTGPQVIDGVRVYFNYRGHQAKGDFGYDGFYYDKDTKQLLVYNTSGHAYLYQMPEGKRLSQKLYLRAMDLQPDSIAHKGDYYW